MSHRDGTAFPTTIASAAAGLAAGTVTARALVDASLDAVDRDGVRTNAFVTVDAGGARRRAEAVDAERRRGVIRGPLHGIPISIKDLIDEAGVVTTAGSRVLAGRIAERDATVIARLREAGAVFIGRTNLHEFALGTTSDASAFGPVHHPWDAGRSAGGSSGGSAAAVAAGMGLASIGTDTGGSVRMPSAACGIVGLKPSRGEVPLDGVVPLSPSLDHVGPLALRVQDAAWLHAVMAGDTPWTVQPARAGELSLVQLAGYFDGPLAPDVRQSFSRALAALIVAGIRITTAAIPDADRIAENYLRVVLPEGAHWHAPFLDARAADYTPSVHSRLLSGRTFTAVEYLAGQAFRDRLRQSVDLAFGDADALVLPTLPIVAPMLGAEMITVEPGTAEVTVRSAMLRHTQPFNLTGHPAITLPIAAPGLPVGLQLVGRRDGTRRLLDVAATIEHVLSS